MAKVKGQRNEMATCIVDHDGSSLAKVFFHELSKKIILVCVCWGIELLDLSVLICLS